MSNSVLTKRTYPDMAPVNIVQDTCKKCKKMLRQRMQKQVVNNVPTQSIYNFDSLVLKDILAWIRSVNAKSQLNGSNGEWTNGDDMPSDDLVIQLDNIKLKKKQRFASSTPHKKKTYGHKVPEGEKVVTLSELEAPEPPYTPLKFVVASEFGYWNGEFHHVDYPPLGWIVVQEGEYVDLCTVNLGYGMQSKRQDGNEPSRIPPAIIWQSGEAFYYKEAGKVHYQTAVQGMVFMPVLDTLSVSLPRGGTLASARYSAIAATIDKCKLPEELSLTTQAWAIYRERKRSLARNWGDTPLTKLDAPTLDYFRECGLTTRFESFIKLPAVQCKVPLEWENKRTFSVSCKGGAEFDPDQGIMPSFPTKSVVDSTPKLSYTQMFRFSGSKKNFVMYDITPENACNALRRLVAARDDEDYFYSNQGMLLSKCKGLVHPSILSKLKLSFSDTSIRVGHGKLSHTIDLTDPDDVWSNSDGVGETDEFLHPVNGGAYFGSKHYYDFMYNRIDRLIWNCGRSKLTEVVDSMKDCAHWAYYKGYEQYLECMESFLGREYAAAIPHVKRALRARYVAGVLLHDDENVMVQQLNACVKKEFAKFGKAPRLFVSYEAGCMYANELPEYVKMCYNGEHSFTKCGVTHRIIIFAKPKRAWLTELMQEMFRVLHVEDLFVYLIYSDDMVVVGNRHGRSFGFNLDIASNDSNNNSYTFSIIGAVLAKFNLRRSLGLIEQCMKPIYLKNPLNKSESIKIMFHSAFEGSGTVLTTILNHTASYSLACSMAYMFSTLREYPDSDEEVEEFIRVSCARCGHKVTIDWFCSREMGCIYEKMQFLKMSPILDENEQWTPTLNYGCIFRSLGTVENDMLHTQLGVTASVFSQMEWPVRMDTFVGSVVAGLVHEPSSIVLDALRKRFPGQSLMAVDWRLDPRAEMNIGHTASARLQEASLARRYDIDVQELVVLAGSVTNVVLGLDIPTIACEAFYAVDYGLK